MKNGPFFLVTQKALRILNGADEDISGEDIEALEFLVMVTGGMTRTQAEQLLYHPVPSVTIAYLENLLKDLKIDSTEGDPTND